MNREFRIEKQYLNFPVRQGTTASLIHLIIDGKLLREFEISLAKTKPDFWVFLDVTEFMGKKITLQIKEENDAFDKIYQADTFPGEENLYKEQLRPEFHFSSRRGWVNDPNGLVYYDGEYHLFYQHNPYGWDTSTNDVNKTWGHAISKDLIHWKELRDAIHPDNLGTIYSGSAVIDKLNTAGFQTGDEKTLVCIYTSAGGRNPWSKDQPFTQSIAYSNDKGRSFTKYSGNPVQDNVRPLNRDPKVFWHEPTNQWVIVLYLENDVMGFFTSKDLKSWQLQSEFSEKVRKRLHECPELFQMAIDGNARDKRWILYAANGRYYIGQFDGKKFKSETEGIRLNYGNCFYASQTFNNIPEEDGRRIQIAWGVNPMPGMPFNQQMLLPVELNLKNTEKGPRIFAQPVREIKKIYSNYRNYQNQVLEDVHHLILQKNGKEGLYDVSAEFEIGSAKRFGLVINDILVIYDSNEQMLYCLERYASLKPIKGKIKFRILADRTTLEIFANDGQIYMPIRTHINVSEISELFSSSREAFLPSTQVVTVKKGDIFAFSEGGKTKLTKLEVYELNSIWD
jgi:sucrose-6-phosphate hydrolase SacC (GH32 family)